MQSDLAGALLGALVNQGDGQVDDAKVGVVRELLLGARVLSTPMPCQGLVQRDSIEQRPTLSSRARSTGSLSIMLDRSMDAPPM